MSQSVAETILDQCLDPLTECLTPEVAKRIVDCAPRATVSKRLEELRRKANQGLLSSAERQDYEEFVESLDLVAILKAKARRLLHRQGA